MDFESMLSNVSAIQNADEELSRYSRLTEDAQKNLQSEISHISVIWKTFKGKIDHFKFNNLDDAEKYECFLQKLITQTKPHLKAIQGYEKQKCHYIERSANRKSAIALAVLCDRNLETIEIEQRIQILEKQLKETEAKIFEFPTHLEAKHFPQFCLLRNRYHLLKEMIQENRRYLDCSH